MASVGQPYERLKGLPTSAKVSPTRVLSLAVPWDTPGSCVSSAKHGRFER